MEFLTEYGLFLAKSVTLVIAILVVVGSMVALGQRQKSQPKGHIDVVKLNERFDEQRDIMREAIIDPDELKKQLKQEKKQQKKALKDNANKEAEAKPRTFLIDFHGDIKASAVDSLREEISSLLTMATEKDEVVVRLESSGGMVHSYGLGSSQLDRIKKKGIPLTVCVDKVAASGGYMMACVADKILAAPFAIMGSIGVVAQLPNFHRLLKKNDIDFELLTAGEHKRTLTMFGQNTDKGREKFLEDLEDTHDLFKQFVKEHRPQLDIDAVANGDVWFGSRALDQKLVDELATSDEYLMDKSEQTDIYEISYVLKKSLPERFGMAAESAVDRFVLNWLERLQSSRFFS
ncbi:MAG: protease SohB [Candidatus Pelagadaptatus aseana]|uniref:protease SohB n=1 Tax=Candidatus Pelagadaptatus aseana TaxID=3120508 RepID=UPI0039B234A5